MRISYLIYLETAPENMAQNIRSIRELEIDKVITANLDRVWPGRACYILYQEHARMLSNACIRLKTPVRPMKDSHGHPLRNIAPADMTPQQRQVCSAPDAVEQLERDLKPLYPFRLQIPEEIRWKHLEDQELSDKDLRKTIEEYREIRDWLFFEFRRLGGYYHRFSYRAREETAERDGSHRAGGLEIWNEYMEPHKQSNTIVRLVETVDFCLESAKEALDEHEHVANGLSVSVIDDLLVARGKLESVRVALTIFAKGMRNVEEADTQLLINGFDTNTERQVGPQLIKEHAAKRWVKTLPEYQQMLEKGMRQAEIIHWIIWDWEEIELESESSGEEPVLVVRRR